MIGHSFSHRDVEMCALPNGALWLSGTRTLVFADLHFGKAERIARREGRLTPPYEPLETVKRMTDTVDHLCPAEVICLGDSFDDVAAAHSIDDVIATSLTRLMAGRSWIWILGNHDPAPTGLGGEYRIEHKIADIVFRHIADKAGAGDISGHYHPKVWLRGRGRPAFLVDARRVILPAFGVYTGGLDATDLVFDDLMEPDALALLTGPRIIPVPRKKLPARRMRPPHRMGASAR